MKKEFKLYVLGAVVVSLAVVVAVLAGVRGDLRAVFFLGAMAVAVSVGTLAKAWSTLRRQEASATHHVAERIPRHRFNLILFRAFMLLVLVAGIVGLVYALVNDYPLYVILLCVLTVINGGGYFLFANLIDK
jgi:cytochrome c biogenesis factor